jgi:hypothetical protein
MRTIWAGVLTALVLGAGGANVTAAPASETVRPTVAAPFEASGQARRREPTRIIVTPRRYQSLPPSAVRQCSSWLQPEYRPSGTVIVPQMRCWWTPG